MRSAALDLGDVWTGIALSDAQGIIAQPYATVTATDLISYLQELIPEKRIQTIVVGLPKTLKGTESAQTLKVKEEFEKLKKAFPEINWIFWDERLTSKQAEQFKKGKSKEEKLSLHAKAAAIILSSYLESKYFQEN